MHDTLELASSARQTHILIVEDNADAAEALAMLLRMNGHDVRIAPDGASALRLTREWTPGAALIDIGLPDMHGLELVRKLRQNEDTKKAAIVAISGYGRPVDIETSLKAGCDYHLVKPVDYEALNAILARERGDK